MSDSLRLLTKNEQIARFFEPIAHSPIFSQKTSNSLRKQLSKFPALPKKCIHDLLIKPNLSLVDQMPRFLCKDGDSVPVYSIHWYKLSFENFIFKTNFYPMISLQIRRASGKKICFIRACSTPDKKSLLALVPPSICIWSYLNYPFEQISLVPKCETYIFQYLF